MWAAKQDNVQLSILFLLLSKLKLLVAHFVSLTGMLTWLSVNIIVTLNILAFLIGLL